MSNVFKYFFSHLEFFLPDPSNKYNLESIFLYYSSMLSLRCFTLKVLQKKTENVFKIMENVEVSKATSIDEIPGRFLKDGKILPNTISEIHNLSISHGIFPNTCKVSNSNLCSSKKVDPSYYRSLSLLPLISKIIGNVVHHQKNEFLLNNKILYNYQYGFWTNHLTNLCLSFLTDKIWKGFDKDLLIGMINWSTESFWHNKPWNLVKENWSYRLFGPMYMMVLVISFWRNIFYRNREPTL